MCSINHDLKAIYIHIPKCGGLFVEKILTSFYNFKTYYFTHENHEEFIDIDNLERNSFDFQSNVKGFLKITKKGVLSYYMSSTIHNKYTGMTLEKWNEYKKFTFIRNPYDRIISAFKYIKKYNNIDFKFEELLESKNSIDRYSYFHTFISQYQDLLDINNCFNIDYIGKFENLNEDLCDILLKIGVDKIKHREILLNNIKLNFSEKENYVIHYDNNLIEKVNNLFYDDFENFTEYKKTHSINELEEDSKQYFITDNEFGKKNIKILKKLDSIGKIVQLDEIYKNLKVENTNNNNNNVDISIDREEKKIKLEENTTIILENGLIIELDNNNNHHNNNVNKNNNCTYTQKIKFVIKNKKTKEIETFEIKNPTSIKQLFVKCIEKINEDKSKDEIKGIMENNNSDKII